jgi:hypothetical protein
MDRTLSCPQTLSMHKRRCANDCICANQTFRQQSRHIPRMHSSRGPSALRPQFARSIQRPRFVKQICELMGRTNDTSTLFSYQRLPVYRAAIVLHQTSIKSEACCPSCLTNLASPQSTAYAVWPPRTFGFAQYLCRILAPYHIPS